MQRGLILLLLFSTAVALTIALALTRYIARPIAEIDDAIRQLGGADFSRPIAVRGPEDLRYLGRRLDWLRRRLEEFETQKNRFLRHVSHELKTPLTALREGAELLNDKVAGPLVAGAEAGGVDRARQQRQAAAPDRGAARLPARAARRGLARSDAGRAGRAGGAKRRGRTSSRRASKGLRLEIDAQAAMLEADPEKLRSIIDNLISQRGQVHAARRHASRCARACDAGEAVIEVIDSGPGVPPEERESIFNLFFRGRTKAEAHARQGQRPGPRHRARAGRGARRPHRRGGAEGSGGHFRVTLPRRSARALADAA